MGRRRKNKNENKTIGIIILVIALLIYAKLTILKDFNPLTDINFHFENPFKRGQIEVTERSVTEDLSELPEQNDIVEDSSVTVFFTKVTNTKDTYVAVSRRKPQNYTGSDIEYATKTLLQGPTKYESSQGICSEIPNNTRLIWLKETPNKVIINLSDGFGFGGGGDSLYKRMYQLIKTVNHNTRKPVYLYINGKQADMIGGEGLMLKQPLRKDSLDE